LALEIQQREREGIAILDLKGGLTLGEEDLHFRDEFQKLAGGAEHRIVLNCAGLGAFDSVGVETLIFAQETLQRLGGKLALANVRVEHLKLLVVMKLEAFFEIFESEIDAVNSFFPERHVERVDVLKLVREFVRPPA
jgi:anti-sigma B factor antagonist